MRDIKFIIDIEKQNYIKKECMQNDDIELNITLFENGIPYNIGTNKVTLNWVKNDNTFVLINTTKEINITNNVVTIMLPRDCTRAVGEARFELSIIDINNKQVSTFPLNIEIIPSVLDGDIESSKNLITAIEEIEAVIDAKKTELNTSVANAQNDINTINARGNDAFPILSTNWIGTEPNLTYVLNHGLNSKNLIVGVLNDDTKFSSMPDFKYIDMNKIEIQSATKSNVTVSINANYYSGKDANIVSQEVIDARGDKNNLKARLDGVDSQLSSVWNGKTATFYGDSITDVNVHYTKGYHQWVKEILGLTSYINYGVGGYKLSDIYYKVCSTSVTSDLIVVMGGVNDQTFNVPLGTITDKTLSTTYGSLNLLCAKLKAKYPLKTVIFVTPAYQTKYPHSGGITSLEVSKAIKEVCLKYAIPVYDNFSLSGIYNTNFSIYTTDNCHWNNKGHELVGKNLAKFILDNFKYINSENIVVGNDVYNDVYIGKTFKATSFKTGNDYFHVIALIMADSDCINGASVDASLTGSSCANMTNYTNDGGGVFSDTTGEVHNSQYVASISAYADHTQTLSGTNLNLTVTTRTLDSNFTTGYLKIPMIVSGTLPFSFKIDTISVKVKGKEKQILKLGSFFTEENYTLT